MRLNLTSTACFLEDLGYLRFSRFFSLHSTQGELLQKVARVVGGVFVGLAIYDLIFHALSFKIRCLIYGTLATVISCIGISSILKRLQGPSSSPEYLPSITEGPISNDESTVEKEEEDFLDPKRNLLAEFEVVAALEGIA